MKKALIVSLLLGTITVGAFAQLTFSGEVHAGVQVQSLYGSRESVTTTHRDGYDPRFDVTATVMRENYGARLDTTFTIGGDGGGMTLNGIYGWVNFGGFFNNDSLLLTMGHISTASWVAMLHSSVTEFYFDKIKGFRLEYATPLPGLSVGVAFRAAGENLERFGKRAIFGGTYIHPLFSAVFSYDLAVNGRALLGFNFIGIPGLTAGLKMRADNFASWDGNEGPAGIFRAHYIVGYRIMRPLNVYMIVGHTNHADSETSATWEITAGVEYRILSNLLGTFSMTLDNFSGNPNNNLTFNPALEMTLRGPAIFYVEYEMRLDNMERINHTFGFGMSIRAF